MKTDSSIRAYRMAIHISLSILILIGAISLSLGPLGAYAHIYGLMTRACVTLTHVGSDIAALLLVTLVGSAALAATVSALSSVLLERRYSRLWHATTGAANRRAQATAASMGITTPINVFAWYGPLACSRGAWSPSIWISDVAVDFLSDDELAAVLVHEEHHCKRRDPAKRQVLEFAGRMLFAFPVVEAAGEKFYRLAEFSADDAAAVATSRSSTARALLRFESFFGAARAVQFGAAATVAERVQRLLGRSVAAERSLLPAGVSASIVVVCAICVASINYLPRM